MARFKITKSKTPIRADYPWTIDDAAQPQWSGWAQSHDEAIEVIEERAQAFPASLKLVDMRESSCVKNWPGAANFEYNPACCRFPKSCSAGHFERKWVLNGTEATA